MADEHSTHHKPSSDKRAAADTGNKLPHLPHRSASTEQPKASQQNEAPTVVPEAASEPTNAPRNDFFHQASPNHQFQEEDIDLSVYPKPTHPGRTVAATVMGLFVLVGLAATWFHFNRNTYSLNTPAQVANSSAVIPTDQPATLGAETNTQQTLSLQTTLPALKQGHYQAWITHQHKTLALGAFRPTDDGLQTLDGQAFAPHTTVAEGDTLFVTIEPSDAATTTPSTTTILSGTIDDQHQASLTFTAIDLTKASGSFILATPTDDQADPTSGLWFAKANNDSLGDPSLNLPPAPSGWAYEGQAVYKGVAIEIGRFSQKDTADTFNSFTTHPENTPNVPGQDFLQKAPGQLGLEFPTNLNTGEWTVVISLEPDQDGHDPTGDDTFYLQPLKATIAQDAEPFTDYSLTRDLSNLPTGTAKFE